MKIIKIKYLTPFSPPPLPFLLPFSHNSTPLSPSLPSSPGYVFSVTPGKKQRRNDRERKREWKKPPTLFRSFSSVLFPRLHKERKKEQKKEGKSKKEEKTPALSHSFLSSLLCSLRCTKKEAKEECERQGGQKRKHLCILLLAFYLSVLFPPLHQT